MGNIAFIDWENLCQTAQADGWEIDPNKFMKYLRDVHRVRHAYCFIGYERNNRDSQKLYAEIRSAGLEIEFGEYNANSKKSSKGNVDTNLVFSVMWHLLENDTFDKIVIVSGDGDYHMLAEYLANQSKLHKILFPSKKSSSGLYSDIDGKYKTYLNRDKTRGMIQIMSGASTSQ